jgi:DNA polymerase delta, subunit 4
MESYLRSGKAVAPSLKPSHPSKRSDHPKPNSSLSPKHATPVVPPAPVVPELTPEEIEDELRLFDLDSSYGPFCGMPRLERWCRAEKLGLNPPKRVLDILSTPGAIEQRDGAGLW